ncbi:hypothetical protein [Sulfurisphaera ohwakuensis]|uniref:hypothetical protein n=1 Tax=Sulfurisphaera ohwakuensis TaxID=69656 RepID=UPI0036F1F612
MDLTKLYNVNSIEEWEELLNNAIENRDKVAILILTDYLRWIHRDYLPKSQNVREYLQHVKYLICNCEKLVDDWLNLHSCEELKEMCNFKVEGKKSSILPIDDKEFIRYIAKGCGIFWVV